MNELDWGRRYLMCPPEHFGVRYQINPWMSDEVDVDLDVASTQWESLKTTLETAGAAVEVIRQTPEVPDLVFTANAGIANAAAAGGPQFVPSHFRHPERQRETELFAEWFEAHGWQVDRLPVDLTHEGAGDALPFGGSLFSAHPFRSDRAAGPALEGLVGSPVRSVELIDERLYHFDITFCPLSDRRAMAAPMAWTKAGLATIEALIPEPLWLTDDEALAFCANSVVVGTTVVMANTPVRLSRKLEAWGFDVVRCDVGEFLKSGGGPRCLTLALDVPLGPGSTGRQGSTAASSQVAGPVTGLQRAGNPPGSVTT